MVFESPTEEDILLYDKTKIIYVICVIHCRTKFDMYLLCKKVKDLPSWKYTYDSGSGLFKDHVNRGLNHRKKLDSELYK